MRPSQVDLIARRMGQLTLGMFAHREYLARYGCPTSFEDLKQHALVGFDRHRYWAKQIAALGLKPTDFRFRSDNLLAQQEAIHHKLGIGVLQHRIAETMPALCEVLADVVLEPMGLWLVAHQELRSSAAVRAVFDVLGEHLTAWCSGDAARSRQVQLG
jgi:DNA-binding transcriptional LysR family regulator